MRQRAAATAASTRNEDDLANSTASTASPVAWPVAKAESDPDPKPGPGDKSGKGDDEADGEGDRPRLTAGEFSSIGWGDS